VPVLLLRGTAFALLMLNRRTLIITWSTLVRLGSLGLSLFVLPLWLEGAAIGAAALVFCMAAETVFAWFFAWKYLLAMPAVRQTDDTFGGYWRFSWPLIINASAEMGVIFTINLYLGRLNEAELAIAAFGVIHGLVSLLMAPMRNLAQTAQTLVVRREDVRTMLVFTGQLTGGFIVFALVLFQTPLRDVVLRGIMGLTPELAAYCEPAMGMAFAMAAFWACSALFRGLLSKARTTKTLALAGVLRIGTAVLAGTVSLFYPDLNGGVLGVGAWVLSYVVETALSGWRLRRLGWFVEA
jgi:O-antigen/teichoic acid export membrane protein